MDEKEKIRRARTLLRGIEDAAKLLRRVIHTEIAGGEAEGIVEQAAKLADVLSGLDLTNESDRRKSRTRKVRRALGYTYP